MNKFIVFLGELIRVMESQGRTGTQETYRATCRSVLAFSGNRSLTLGELFTRDFLHRYQAFLRDRGCCYNTVSSYMRVLRAIRNKAEKRGLVSTEPDLFDRLCTGSEPTRKRALPNGVILRLSRVDLSAHPHLAAGREIFMLLFFLQGMSFVDLAHLRKSDLKNGYITYRRRKSGAPVSVKVWPPARALLERYLSRDKDSPYLLSILEDGAQYRTLLRRFNRHLNALGELLGLGESLTSYVARHSWATAAYRIGVPTALIGEAMGHKTEEVTRVYLASFDTETMDYAGRMVWESLFKDETADKETKKHHRKGKQDWIRDVSLLAGERHDSDANVKRSF